MMLDVFLMLGVVVPLAGSNIFFSENVSLIQWLGLFILLTAAFVMCSYNNSIKQKITFSLLLLLMLCGFSNGLADFSQKFFVKSGSDFGVSVFSFYTYLFSAISLLAVFAFLKGKGEENYSKADMSGVWGPILIMSLCLFGNSIFKTKAAFFLPSVLLYPLSQGLSLILSSLMAAIFFKEKITLKSIVGMVLAFSGLVIINI